MKRRERDARGNDGDASEHLRDRKDIRNTIRLVIRRERGPKPAVL